MCSLNQYRDSNGVCQCYPGYYKGNYPTCQPVNCPPGTAFDYVRGDCLSICRPNECYINGACVCQVGFNKLNGYGDCVRDCTALEINVNGFCQCPNGYVRVSMGICVVEETGPGKCPPGSIYMFGKCLPPTLCGANEYWCGSGCACNNGYYRVNGECVPVQPTLVCPVNSASNGVNCLCKPGFFPVVPGLCDRCPPGTTWDGRRCSGGGYNGGPYDCQPGWVYDPIRGYCIRVT